MRTSAPDVNLPPPPGASVQDVINDFASGDVAAPKTPGRSCRERLRLPFRAKQGHRELAAELLRYVASSSPRKPELAADAPCRGRIGQRGWHLT
jgi:hypothetical protein